MKSNNLQDLEYLKDGTLSQKKAYNILASTKILSLLKQYTPLVAGTIPIGIDIEGSDIDIVCNAENLEDFRDKVQQNFAYCHSFYDKTDSNENVYTAVFKYENMEIEIYAKSQPSHLQNGYRHMIIEERLLRLGGEIFKDQIINLKKSGYKTEPAFGILLDLKNPYEDLLRMEHLTDEELKLYFKNPKLT